MPLLSDGIRGGALSHLGHSASEMGDTACASPAEELTDSCRDPSFHDCSLGIERTRETRIVRSVQRPLPRAPTAISIFLKSIADTGAHMSSPFQAGNNQSIVVRCTMRRGLCLLPVSATKDERPTSYELGGTPSIQSVSVHGKTT